MRWVAVWFLFACTGEAGVSSIDEVVTIESVHQIRADGSYGAVANLGPLIDLYIPVDGQSNAEGRGLASAMPAVVNGSQIITTTGVLTQHDPDTVAPNTVGLPVLVADALISRAPPSLVRFNKIYIVPVAKGGTSALGLYDPTPDDRSGAYNVKHRRADCAYGDVDENTSVIPRNAVVLLLSSQGETDANPAGTESDSANWATNTLARWSHILDEDYPGTKCIAIAYTQLPPSAPSGAYTDWGTIRSAAAGLEDVTANPKRLMTPWLDADREPTDLVHMQTSGYARAAIAIADNVLASVTDWAAPTDALPYPLTAGAPIRWFNGRNMAETAWESCVSSDGSSTNMDLVNGAGGPDRTAVNAAFNNQPTLSFVSSNNDVLAEAATSADWRPAHDGTGFTLAIYLRWDSATATNQTILTTMGAFSASNTGLFIRFTGSSIRVYVGNGTTAVLDANVSAVLTEGDKGILLVRFDASRSPGDQYDVRWLGASIASGSTLATPAAGNPSSPLRVGRGPSIQPSDITVAEIVAWPLWVADPAAVESYLTGIYGAQIAA